MPPPPLPPLLLVRGVRRQCDMQYGNHRGTLRGPMWMLDVVARPLNRLPGAHGKGSTTGQRHTSPSCPRRPPSTLRGTRGVWITRNFFVPTNCFPSLLERYQVLGTRKHFDIWLGTDKAMYVECEFWRTRATFFFLISGYIVELITKIKSKSTKKYIIFGASRLLLFLFDNLRERASLIN